MDDCHGQIKSGVDASLDREPTAKADSPFMQRMVDAIEDRCGKATSPNHNLTVEGGFRQPWER